VGSGTRPVQTKLYKKKYKKNKKYLVANATLFGFLFHGLVLRQHILHTIILLRGFMVALSRGREVAWRLACFWSCIDVNMDRVKVSNHRNCAILPWGSTPLNQKIQQYFTYFVFRALHPREQTSFSTRGSGRDSVKYLPRLESCF
jgi:hypothetical protein